MTANELIDQIIQREGGYVNHPDDRGGPTKFGITLLTLGAYRRAPVNADDVRALTVEEAKTIYRTMYVDEPKFSTVKDERLRALLVDSGVQHGTRRAIRWLQGALGGLAEDGILGTHTHAALEAADPAEVYRKVLARRMKYYGEIVRDNPSQSVFIVGWLTRLSEFLA